MIHIQEHSLVGQLVNAIGAEHVLRVPDVMAAYVVDWTGRYQGNALCVVRPETVEQVSSILHACNIAGVGVVPQGGNTGLVGGSVPAPDSGAVVLSLTRLNSMGPVDPVTGQVSVGAGVTLAALHAHAKAAGWSFGVDLAARDSATIGGMVATNAGGIHVVGNGMMRKQVLGIEAVLATGEVIRSMSGLAKNNTGYDLTQLLCGSEGTLGVITEVSLQLIRPRSTELILAGCDSVNAALAIASRFTGQLAAAEIMDRSGIVSVSRVTGITVPFPTPFHVLVEVSGGVSADSLEDLEHVTLAMDSRDRENYWALRERITEAMAVECTGVSHKLDISVPLADLDTVYREITTYLDQPGVRDVVLFGHLMDGNFHVFFTTDTDGSDEEALDIAVLELVAAHGGSISAEHGVGHMKADHLHLSRSSAEIAAMRGIKAALDPQGILNPGVLFTR
jgi:FAD/FMN-containing dehydrogenase